MLELAANGAKVLYIRAVEYARRHGVLIHARSTFSSGEGTWVLGQGMTLPAGAAGAEGEEMEEPIVAGVATDLSQAKITVIGVPDVPGKAAEIFKIVAKSGANVDMIVQNVSAASTGRTDISFTLPKEDAATALRALAAEQAEVGFESLVHDDQIGKLSVVGRRHAHALGRLGDAVRGAERLGHQHRDDLDQSRSASRSSSAVTTSPRPRAWCTPPTAWTATSKPSSTPAPAAEPAARTLLCGMS